MSCEAETQTFLDELHEYFQTIREANKAMEASDSAWAEFALGALGLFSCTPGPQLVLCALAAGGVMGLAARDGSSAEDDYENANENLKRNKKKVNDAMNAAVNCAQNNS